MIETAIILLPILIADVINPVLFAFLVYAASGERPLLNSSALLLGHVVAYLSAGIAIALSLEQITSYLANPSHIDYAIGLLVGILLVWVALPAAKKPEQKRPEQSHALTPLSAFGIGAVVNLVGIPFALPYFAAIDQILKADLSSFEAVVLLVAYNVIYALPFLIVPALVALLGERSRPLLQRINTVLERVSAFLMPVILGVVGVALVLDAVLYFATGNGLF
jgi:cytochrome c biogenesis protein CcdA